MFVACDDWLEALAWVEKNDSLLLSFLCLLQNEPHHLSYSSLSSLNSLFLLFGESNVVLSPLHELNQLSWLLSSAFSSWSSYFFFNFWAANLRLLIVLFIFFQYLANNFCFMWWLGTENIFKPTHFVLKTTIIFFYKMNVFFSYLHIEFYYNLTFSSQLDFYFFCSCDKLLHQKFLVLICFL